MINWVAPRNQDQFRPMFIFIHGDKTNLFILNKVSGDKNGKMELKWEYLLTFKESVYKVIFITYDL